jgi:hypothetical protein
VGRRGRGEDLLGGGKKDGFALKNTTFMVRNCIISVIVVFGSGGKIWTT